MVSRRNPPRLRAVLGALAVMLGMLAPAAAAEPARIIFDTDMDSDCDDAGALAMLHALADRGEAEILATLVSSHHPWSAACVDAINTNGTHEWRVTPDNPRHSYVSALAEGAEARELAATIEELMLHQPAGDGRRE